MTPAQRGHSPIQVKHSMTHSSPTQALRFSLLGLMLPLLFLTGCGSAPEQETTPEQPVIVPQEPEGQPGAALTLPPSEFSEQFSTAEALLARFNWMSAASTLEELPVEQLSANDRVYMQYLQARIAWTRGNTAQASAILEQLDYPGMNLALQYRILNFQRHILEMGGDNLASAQLGDRILRMAPASDTPALRRSIWRDLERLDDADLRKALAAATDPQWRGWLQLALIDQNQLTDSRLELFNWRSQNPVHPAAIDMPGGLAHLLEDSPKLDTVALLLPLSGRLSPAGKAVRDGYMASYYTARSNGAASHEVVLLDTDTYTSANSAYDEALAKGADLVVGPLSKAAVSELHARPERTVPILALNRIDAAQPVGGSALVQLSLAPEDEAGRIAELAFGQGARSALVVRPAGAWGSKMEKALRERWRELGGGVASTATFESRDKYSANIKNSLGLSASEQRARNVRDMLATNVEFTARRRQDLDVVFLLARSGAEARSLKPLLAFHYAGGLPVYSTSSIYSGIPDNRDRDLDGINLVETPWLLGSSPALRVAIAAGDTGSDSYTRLNALGADAYLLQTNFSRLQAGPDALLRGNTGLLSMDPRLRIERELPLATFDGGELKSR